MNPTKACPVVLRQSEDAIQILAFRHPLAGSQLVKGTIEPGELPTFAAMRELAEEAGITDARAVRDLGLWDSSHPGQVWWLVQVEPASSLPTSWEHRTEDDGGHTFVFFWHPLHSEPGAEWHPLFAAALRRLQECFPLPSRHSPIGPLAQSSENAA